MRVIILGAGITGLAAATELVTHGHHVTLLEKQEQVGGLAATLSWKNHVLDYGAFVCYPAFKAQLPETVINALDLQPVPGMSSQVYLNGSWSHWPMPLGALCRDMGATGCLIAATDLLTARLKYINPQRIHNAKDYMKARIGDHLLHYSHLADEIKKFTGFSAQQLSPRFVTDHLFRFEELRLRRVLLQPFRSHKPTEPVALPLYPRGGIGAIPAQLETYLTQQGAQFYKGCTIKALHTEQERVTAVSFSHQGNTLRLHADVVISTIPLEQVIVLLGKKPIGALASRHLLLLFLLINKPSLTGHQLSYAFDERIPFKRLVEFKYYDPRQAPPDQTGVAAEICYPHHAAQPELPLIYEQVKNSLHHMGLLDPVQILDHCFRVSPYAYPVETLGFEKIRDHMLDTVTMDNLVSCGRQGIFRYSQLSFAWAMGTEAALLINQGKLKKEFFLTLAHEFADNRGIGG